MFNRYPYTNFHELNLDYFIQHFNEIFTEWEQLYNELQSWKTDTTEELAQWRADVEADLNDREAALRAELEIWKQDTADDISEWETATLNALDAWKTAATAQFEAIRVQAAASAEAAATSQTAAASAAAAALLSETEAEEAAAAIQASAAQIQQNTDDISELKTQITQSDEVFEDGSFVYEPVYTNNTVNDYTGEQSIANNGRASTPALYYFPKYSKLGVTYDNSYRFYIYCFDENKTYLGYVGESQTSGGYVTLKTGTRYMRFFAVKANGSDITISEAEENVSYTCIYNGRVYDDEVRLSVVEGGLSTAQTKIESLLSLQNISDLTPSTGYVKINDGTIVNNASYLYVQFNVVPGIKLHYKTKTDESSAGIAFYDKYDVFIPSSGQAATRSDAEITVPSGAVIARASYRSGEQADFYVRLKVRSQDVADNRGFISDFDVFLFNAKLGQSITGYANINTGSISTNEGYKYYKFAVFGGEKVKYKTATSESVAGIVFYNERDEYISGTAATTSEQIITVPNDASYAIAACRATQVDELVIETAYPTQLIANLANSHNPYKPQFVLPAESIAVVGHEWNCYFDNVIRGMDFEKYAVYVRSITGTVSSKKYFERFLRIEPEAGDIGTHIINLQIVDKKYCTVVDDVTFTLRIIADATLSGKKVMFIGDSLTNAGIYPAEVQFNLSDGGITSVGTREATVTIGENTYTVKHEGRAGWASYDYTRSVPGYKTDVANPFWDGTKFSFSYYMTNSGVSKPDIVCIGLGTNGGMSGVSDVLTMVESIHDYDSTIPVLVSLITPPADQNGCGYLIGMQSAALLKCEFLDVNSAYISEYDGGEYTGVTELYFQFDRQHDFPTATIPVSARNPETMTIQANNVHPSTYGYLHFADAYYNKLLYLLS